MIKSSILIALILTLIYLTGQYAHYNIIVIGCGKVDQAECGIWEIKK